MKKKRLIDLLIIILVCVMAFSGYKLYSIMRDSKESKEQYQQLEQLIEAPQNPADSAMTSAQKYQSIYDQNNDFIGWIYIPDTALSYPVMQTPAKPEYYLRRNFEGKYSVRGVPFVDYRCTLDFSDNTIVYGHNMMNGTMFSVLESYSKESFWQTHRYIGFDTMNGYGTYAVVLCARIDLRNTDFNYIDTIDFSDAEEFDSYIAKINETAFYETDIELSFGDKLLLLSTCQSNYDDGRYIVIAKKISDQDLSSAGI